MFATLGGLELGPDGELAEMSAMAMAEGPQHEGPLLQAEPSRTLFVRNVAADVSVAEIQSTFQVRWREGGGQGWRVEGGKAATQG